MGTSVEETIKEIQGRENIFVAYSQTTKLPYVTCGEESFNDQAWFFTEEEAIKEFGKKKIEEKVLLMGMRYEKKDFPKMYGLLFSIGVNTIMWNDGGEQMEIDLAFRHLHQFSAVSYPYPHIQNYPYTSLHFL